MTSTFTVFAAVLTAYSQFEVPEVKGAADLPKMVGHYATADFAEFGNVFHVTSTLNGRYLFAGHCLNGMFDEGIDRHDVLCWEGRSRKIERWWFDSKGAHGRDLLSSREFFEEKAKAYPDPKYQEVEKATLFGFLKPFSRPDNKLYWLYRGRNMSTVDRFGDYIKELSYFDSWNGVWDVATDGAAGVERNTTVDCEWILYGQFLASTKYVWGGANDKVADAMRIRVFGSDSNHPELVRCWEFRDDGSHAELKLSTDKKQLKGTLIDTAGKKRDLVVEIDAHEDRRVFVSRLSSVNGSECSVMRETLTRKTLKE